jgi:hypothetical protein
MDGLPYNDGFSQKWVEQLAPIEWREHLAVQFVDVPVGAVEAAQSIIDPEVVEGWREYLTRGCSFPPPVASKTENGTYYLHDGNHRFRAYRTVFAEADTVRVAVVAPVKGFCFEKRKHDGFYTYELAPIPALHTRLLPYVVPVVACVAAVMLTAFLPLRSDSPVLVLFVASVLLATRFAGVAAGFIAVLLNLAAAAFFFLPPRFSFLVNEPEHIVYFGLTSLVMLSVVAAWMRPRDLPRWLHAKRRHLS